MPELLNIAIVLFVPPAVVTPPPLAQLPHVGAPPAVRVIRHWLGPVEANVDCNELVPLPYSTPFRVKLFVPVPPWLTAKVPDVMLLAFKSVRFEPSPAKETAVMLPVEDMLVMFRLVPVIVLALRLLVAIVWALRLLVVRVVVVRLVVFRLFVSMVVEVTWLKVGLVIVLIAPQTAPPKVAWLPPPVKLPTPLGQVILPEPGNRLVEIMPEFRLVALRLVRFEPLPLKLVPLKLPPSKLLAVTD